MSDGNRQRLLNTLEQACGSQLLADDSEDEELIAAEVLSMLWLHFVSPYKGITNTFDSRSLQRPVRPRHCLVRIKHLHCNHQPTRTTGNFAADAWPEPLFLRCREIFFSAYKLKLHGLKHKLEWKHFGSSARLTARHQPSCTGE